MHNNKKIRLQRYLDYFANHPVYSVILFIFLAVSVIASLTDNFSRLADFAKNLFDKSMPVNMHVQNLTRGQVDIQPVCEVEAEERVGNKSYSYSGERLRLSSVGSWSDQHAFTLHPSEARDYCVAIPDQPMYRGLFERGISILNFTIYLGDGSRSVTGSIRFNEDSLRHDTVNIKIE